jgi:uncharacterized protein YukE
MSDTITQIEEKVDEVEAQVSGFFDAINGLLSWVPEPFTYLIAPIEDGMASLNNELAAFWDGFVRSQLRLFGSPIRVREVARDWEANVANNLGAIVDSLQSDKFTTDYTWSGSGADAYQGLVPAQRESLAGIEDAVRDLATTLESLADGVDTFLLAILAALLSLVGGVALAIAEAGTVVGAAASIPTLVSVVSLVVGFVVSATGALLALVQNVNTGARAIQSHLDQLPEFWDGGSADRLAAIRDDQNWRPTDEVVGGAGADGGPGGASSPGSGGSTGGGSSGGSSGGTGNDTGSGPDDGGGDGAGSGDGGTGGGSGGTESPGSAGGSGSVDGSGGGSGGGGVPGDGDVGGGSSGGVRGPGGVGGPNSEPAGGGSEGSAGGGSGSAGGPDGIGSTSSAGMTAPVSGDGAGTGAGRVVGASPLSGSNVQAFGSAGAPTAGAATMPGNVAGGFAPAGWPAPAATATTGTRTPTRSCRPPTRNWSRTSAQTRRSSIRRRGSPWRRPPSA